MKLPKIRTARQPAAMLKLLPKGLDRTQNAAEGELQGCRNLTFSGYPTLSVRSPRSLYRDITDADDLFSAGGSLYFCRNGKLYADDEELCTVLPGKKRFALVNTKLVVFPDKLMVDTVTGQVKKMDASAETSGERTILKRNEIVFPDGSEDLTELFRKGDAVTLSGYPLDGNNKDVFVEEVKPHSLLFPQNTFIAASRYAGFAAVSDFADKPPVVITRSSDNSGYKFFFETVDGKLMIKTIEGGEEVSKVEASNSLRVFIDDSEAETDVWIVEEDDTPHLAKATFASHYLPSDWTLITPTEITSLSLTVKRKMPDLDDICEKDNRLWGVVNHQSNKVWDAEKHEWVSYESRMICASALGMPDDFYDYTGVYSGAYAVAVASEGDFTAVCAMDGDVLCWKENALYKVLGSFPAEYGTVRYEIPGVAEGAGRSMVIHSETLYYLGKNGIYAYSGNIPVLLSEKLGTLLHEGGAAGTDGNTLLFSLFRSDGGSEILSYDLLHGLWLCEDGENAVFCRHEGKLLMLTQGKALECGKGVERVKWYAGFAPIRTPMSEVWRGACLFLRAETGEDSFAEVFVSYDGGVRQSVGRLPAGENNTLRFRLRQEKFESVSVYIEGRGACRLRGMSIRARRLER